MRVPSKHQGLHPEAPRTQIIDNGVVLVDIHSKFLQALQTQGRAEYPIFGSLLCPSSGHEGRMFADVHQLLDHLLEKAHEDWEGIKHPKPGRAKKILEEAAHQSRTQRLTGATAGSDSAPDVTNLSLKPEDKSRQSSPYSGKKRPANSEGHGRRTAPTHVKTIDADYNRNIPHSVVPERARKLDAAPLFDPNYAFHKGASAQRSAPGAPSDWSRNATKKSQFKPYQPQSPSHPLPHRPTSEAQYYQSQRHDTRYPDLVLQLDNLPITQEQLASEIKSIYAGLTMVETKCDRAQAAAAQNSSDPNHKLASDHWQGLITLHRTLLHEYHDFFLASQHPSALPALRRLPAKYSMPARMWKHGIHSFLELLRRRLPDSIDYTLAFIYLAYQMMALLYETVPAFEDTWIECLGDLGRYRMAIEDEDICDRETWAGVARSWYTKASDKNPTVGRLYHHLAILARPNALEQLYYYSRSLTCVKPFPSARESILTLLDPILGRAAATYSHTLPIDTNYIKAHALLFEKLSLDDFKQARTEFLDNLDNHIGRATAKWKEQGVCIAVTNVAGWFSYGVDDNSLRQVFLTELVLKAKNSPAAPEEQPRTASPADQQDPTPPSVPENELLSTVNSHCSQPHFEYAKKLTFDTFALALRRIGDKNVLPHVHIMLCFLSTFASNRYVSHLLADTPWAELVAFLNTLIKTESQIQSQIRSQTTDSLFSSPVFPNEGERGDELPLPEDYLVRGLIWAHEYFPKKWFEREHDEEERNLELASTVKSRIERVLRLGYALASHGRWIAYDEGSHAFSLLPNTPVPASRTDQSGGNA